MRSCTLAVQTSVYNTSLRVAKPTLNSITRAPTTGAQHTASTEHDRDSQECISSWGDAKTLRGPIGTRPGDMGRYDVLLILLI